MKVLKGHIKNLLARIGRDDREAFNQFFALYYNRLIQFAQLYVNGQEEAEDIVSDVLVQLLRKRKELHKIDRFESYLFLSVKNTALNFIKKEKRFYDYCAAEVDGVFLPSRVSEPFELLLEEELRQLVFRVVEKFPNQRKMVYKLIKDEGLKYQEVADLLEVSIKTVEAHLGLAVKQVREAVENYLTDQTSVSSAYK